MSTTRSTRSASSRFGGEAGIGLIGSVAGVVAFLAFLLFAVQVTYDLYATSAVTAAAFDAVRVVAGSDAFGDPAATATAEAEARRALGGYARRVAFDWSRDADEVSLRVRSKNPGFLPTAIRRPLGVDVVDRTVRARIEKLR